jgi:aryl-alcohol dehydrogenase-like predicted oxidoreductase
MIKNINRISKLGLGLYLGEESVETDERILEVMQFALDQGILVFDCAPSYRNLRSEKLLGDLLQRNPEKDVIISTKGGFVPFDFKQGIESEIQYVRRLIERGLIREELFDQEHFQTFDFNYLDYMLTNTLLVLNRKYADIYYLHNPEYFLERVGRPMFLNVMKSVFLWLRDQLQSGRIGSFGISSWNGFFNDKVESSLQLEEFYRLAKEIGIEHDFSFIQIPFNFLQTQGLFFKNQSYENEKFSLIRLAKRLGISIISSAPLGQGRLLKYKFPVKVKNIFSGMSASQTNLSFVLSTPGITCTLVGTTSLEHFKEAASIYCDQQYGEQRFIDTILSKL